LAPEAPSTLFPVPGGSAAGVVPRVPDGSAAGLLPGAPVCSPPRVPRDSAAEVVPRVPGGLAAGVVLAFVAAALPVMAQ